MDLLSNIKWVILSVIISVGLRTNGMFCASMNDTRVLISNILFNYDVNVRPVDNQSEPVNVSVMIHLKSIQEFNEVKEMFSYVAALSMQWNDANMRWKPAEYGGVEQITLSYDHVWKPLLVLASPSEKVDTIGKTWNIVRYFHNGQAVSAVADLIKSTCAVNVEKYPFDIQSCTTTFLSMGYTQYELMISARATKAEMGTYEMNTQWDIVNSEVKVSVREGGSVISLTVNLKRKPTFIVINVLMPLLFLNLLNALVFFLVADSGERVSYCITVLLAIAVFMTIVSDMLPRSSEPVPIISYKLMIDLISSSLIVMATIGNLKMYHKGDGEPVPNWLAIIYQSLSRRCCNCQRKKYVHNAKDNRVKPCSNQFSPDEKKVNITNEKSDTGGTKRDALNKKPVQNKTTWKQISAVLDYMFFAFFMILAMSNFVGFLLIAST